MEKSQFPRLAASVAGACSTIGLDLNAPFARIVSGIVNSIDSTKVLFDEEHTRVLAALRAARTPVVISGIVRRQYRLQDQLFSDYLKTTSNAISCQKGCAYCCHLRVDVLPWEVFLIVEYIHSRLSRELVDDIALRAKADRDALGRLTPKERLCSNLPCPLLRDGVCLCYEVRPHTCRRYHAQTVSTCEYAYRHPEDLASRGSEIMDLKIFLSVLSAATDMAFADRGYDARAYDLVTALAEAIEDPKCVKRWRRGNKPFSASSLAKNWVEECEISETPSLSPKNS